MLKRRTRDSFDGPYLLLERALSLVHLSLALEEIESIWEAKESLLSKRTPRNLPLGCVGIWVLWHKILGADFSSRGLRKVGLNINSNDLSSLILILLLPQKSMTWFKADWRLACVFLSVLLVV